MSRNSFRSSSIFRKLRSFKIAKNRLGLVQIGENVSFCTWRFGNSDFPIPRFETCTEYVYVIQCTQLSKIHSHLNMTRMEKCVSKTLSISPLVIKSVWYDLRCGNNLYVFIYSWTICMCVCEHLLENWAAIANGISANRI